MKKCEIKPERKQPYVEPKATATYEKDELEEVIKPEGNCAIFASTELIVPIN